MTIGGDQWGVVYELEHADGTRAVFNDDTDPDYVGLARFPGLEDGEVREVADDRTDADGGVHGDFWRGRRPVVINVEMKADSATDRNEKYDRLWRATHALRSDAVLTWTPDGGAEQFLRLRKNGRLARGDDSGWLVKYQVPMVAAEPRKFSTTLNSADEGDSLTIVNAGTSATPAAIRINGAETNPKLVNTTTGETLGLTYTLAGGHYLLVDFAARTVKLDGVTNVYSAVDDSPQWWQLAPGNNVLDLYANPETAAASSGTLASVTYPVFGSVAWSNPSNAASSNDSYATFAAGGGGAVSHVLQATNFGFAIPSGATILGITAEVERKSSAAAANSLDTTGFLVRAGALDAQKNPATQIPSSDTYTTFGGPTDLWGAAWTRAEVNSSTFGFGYAATLTAAGTVSVDHIRVAVAYRTNLGDYQIDWRDAWG